MPITPIEPDFQNNFEEKIKSLKMESCSEISRVKILQFVRGLQEESTYIPVEKIFVDLNCESFTFNIVDSANAMHNAMPSYPCLEKFSYCNLNQDRSSVVILGLPGAGKSTLMKMLFKEYSVQEKVIPIYVELKTEDSLNNFERLWNKGQAVSISDFNEYVKKYFTRYCTRTEEESEQLLQYVNNKRYKYVVFCDGLDEISKEQYEKFTNAVGILNRNSWIQFIISSRQVGFSRKDYSDSFKLYSLLDFSVEKQEEFINKYFLLVSELGSTIDTEKQKNQLTNLLKKPFIQRMAKSPILLSLLCVTPELDNIRSKTQLFENAIAVLLLNRNIEVENIELFINFLKHIAVVFFKLDNSESFDAKELEFYADKFFCAQNTETCSILKSKYLDCGLFDQIVFGTKREYKFAHRTIWEYLVAEGMADRDKNEIYSRANMEVWEEPIKMWVSLVMSRPNTNKEEIFKGLWQRNKALTLVCMNELETFPNEEFNILYNGLTKRDKLRLIATLRDSYVNPSSDYRKQAINTIQETLSLIHNVERDCEVVYAYLEFLEEFKDERVFRDLLYNFLDYQSLSDRKQKMMTYGLTFINVPAGSFTMGRDKKEWITEVDRNNHINVDAEETPAHNVRITKPFKISKTLVTNKMFYDSGFPYINSNNQIPTFKGNTYSESDNQPVNYVNWYEAMVFAKWLGCTLATEAEWEYACRGNNNDYMSDNLDDMIVTLDRVACYASRNVGHPNKTRSVLPSKRELENSIGLIDMLGNLREWCLDWYSDDFYEKCQVKNYPTFSQDIIGHDTVTYFYENGYPKITTNNFTQQKDTFTFDINGFCLDPIKRVPGKFEAKCLRGGCFDWNESNLRPTYRNHNPANNVYKVNGFRLVIKEI